MPLSDLLCRLQEIYGPVAEDAGHTLITQIAPQLSVTGDAPLLTQMFSNLVENAIVHTPAGTRIVLEAQGVNERTVAVAVHDDGPGLAAGEENHVFRRFYRGLASRKQPGSGLGLSLVSAIANLHGAEHRIVGGSGFRIEFLFERLTSA